MHVNDLLRDAHGLEHEAIETKPEANSYSVRYYVNGEAHREIRDYTAAEARFRVNELVAAGFRAAAITN